MDKGKTYDAPPWSALPSADFQLEVLKDGSIVDTIELKDKEFFTLGRQHGLVDITMDHPSISRVHAVLNFRDDGALMLRDMGSAQGTQLNKVPCEKDTYYRVYVGDMIRFGASTRKYIVMGPEEHRKEEYNSANMENYREKLAIRSAEIKVKLDKEAEKESFSWGMREDAENTEEPDDKPEEELPEYLKKLKNDEHFERKYGEKFAADIKESEAKNSKDAEILDKIRKKERKIQNMQEENRRIYLKENTQDSGLTEGQMAAVNRNDKSISSLQEEIEQLIGQIRAKTADRAGPGGTGGNKRAIDDADDDLLDLTTQTADASTNWRLRKKLQKTANFTTGSSENTSGEMVENRALSYAEIKQQLAAQNELRAKLDRQVDETAAFIGTQDSMLCANGQQDDLDSVLARDRAAEGRATLKRLQNDQAAVALKVSRLEKLLKVATPALSSLVNSKSGSNTSSSARGEVGEVVALPAPTVSSDSSMDAPQPVAKRVQGPSLRQDAADSAGSATNIPAVAATAAPSGDDRLKNLMRFIEEEKLAEEAERRRKEEEAQQNLAQTSKAPKSAHSESSVPMNSSGETATMNDTDRTSSVKRPAPAPMAAPVSKSASFKAPTGAPRVQGPQGPPVYQGNVLEGGESDWVPPPKQSGDGKTALNAKYGPDMLSSSYSGKYSSFSATSTPDASLSRASTRNNFSSPVLLRPLPSLATELPPSAKQMTSTEFANSIPVFRRERFDLFGLNGDNDGFNKKEGYNYNEVKSSSPVKEPVGAKSPTQRLALIRNLSQMRIEKQQEDSTNTFRIKGKGGKRRDSVGYNIHKLLGGNDPFMKSEDERKEKLEKAVQMKKDKMGDDLFNKRKKLNSRSSISRTSAQQESDMMELAEAIAKQESQETESAEKGENELEGKEDQFFGEKARVDFALRFKNATKDLERYSDESKLPPEKLTPRSLYLREGAKKNLLPLPIILRKDSNPMGVHLPHRGIGDDKMFPLIKVMDTLPAIQTIDLCDNRLTDQTLIPLAAKLLQFKSLTHLDLSFNKMDKSSATIMDFLKSEDCKLFTLLLNGADIDDNECKNIADAMSLNKSIKTLGLSKNLIGNDELLNVLNPSMITGGEALGAMLKMNNTLTELDLSWNGIRLESAIAIGEALEFNSTLKTLFLGYNSFGDMPSQILGRTLKTNVGLTLLDLEYNSITPKAATVLANAISFNETLLKLNINGNVLGKIGAQALVAAIQRSSRENRALQVSFINCDCVMDEGNIFSAGNPHGTWRLNLKEPYGQMVAAECMYLANYKAGCRIVRLYVNNVQVVLERAYIVGSDEGEAGVLKKFKLEEFYKNSRVAANEMLAENMPEASKALNNILAQFDFKMEEEMRLQVLQKTLDLWTAKAKREGRDDLQEVFLYEIFFSLFVINDVDMSGTMELDEFLETLSSLGKPNFDPAAAKRLMDEHDKDESGSIDANEFGQIMLTEFCQTDLPKGDLVDASTGKPWEIPASGHCLIQLSYQCDVPTFFDIGEDHGIDNIIQSIRDAKTDEQREILFQNTTSSPYFFLSFDQAQLLFEEMQGLNRLPLELMANILPQIVNEEQTNKFIDTNLNDKGKLALRVKLGQLYNSYVGLHTGHYAIDMKAPDQRNGGRRLGAISVTEGKFAQQAGSNSSQKGNRSNFRNEKLGYSCVDVTGRWFASVNTTQTLHCDYVSTMKPRKGTPPMTDSRLERIIETLQLRDIRVVWDRLMRVKFEYMRTLEEDSDDDSLGGDMDRSLSFHSWNGEENSELSASRKTSLIPSNMAIQRASTVAHLAPEPVMASTSSKMNNGSARLDFLSTLPDRNPNIRESSRAKASKKTVPPIFTQLMPGFFIDLSDFPELEPEAPLTVQVMRDVYTEYMDTCHDYYDIYPEERMRDVSRANYSATERPPTPEAMRTPPPPPKGYFSPIFPLAYRCIVQLQIMMPTLYMTVAQLSKLLEYFPPDEGYLRIQLIQSVFSHVVDLELMYQIYDNVLTVSERLELFHRIGIMNIMDPMKPDRLYLLDLRRWDHREWVKILVALAVAEPGDNWEQVEYRWGKYDEPVPGWTLPGTWTWHDDGGHNGGPRVHGWLKVYYRSVGNGCFPIMSLRKYLRKRTLAGMKVIL